MVVLNCPIEGCTYATGDIEATQAVALFVTSTSQHQIFDEKFDQEPKNVRIKMADLAGP